MKLTPKQAAARQSISVGLVYRLCATRRLTHYRVGATGRGKILIEESDLEALLEAMKVADARPIPTASRPPPQSPLRHLKLK